MRSVNRCAVLDEKGATPKVKECVLERECVVSVQCVYLSSSGIRSTVSLNYTNKLIGAGGTPQALQPCLRLRADRALRHNTLLQQGKHVRLVNYPPQTNTETNASQPNSHTYVLTEPQ